MRTLVLALLLVIGTGCHLSSTWTDDSQNWWRAFGEKQPEDVEVIHSSYWRSPRFTLEFVYFFEIAPCDRLLEQFGQDCNLRRVTVQREGARVGGASQNDEVAAAVLRSGFEDKPEWFVPKPLEDYEIWKSYATNRVFENMRVFVDRETGTLFIINRSF